MRASPSPRPYPAISGSSPTTFTHLRARNAPHGGDSKTSNIIKPSAAPAQAILQECRSRSQRPARPGFSASPRIPAPHEKFPARSLLGAKKFPALLLREFCSKNLKSSAFSARIFPQKAEFPANSLRAGNFSPCPASKSRSASASSTDPIWAHPARSGVLLVDSCECGRVKPGEESGEYLLPLREKVDARSAAG